MNVSGVIFFLSRAKETKKQKKKKTPDLRLPSSLNEGRRPTRIIWNDDSLFNYFIKIKDYIVKTTRSLVAETFSIAYVKVFRLFIYLIVENT